MLTKKMGIRMLAVLAIVSLCQMGLFGQSLISGDIKGTVTDQQMAAVPGASVIATNTGTNVNQRQQTDAQGAYRFAFLPPGTYRLDVSKSGFQTVQRSVQVLVSQAIAVDVQLSVSGVVAAVSVVEGAALIQTENADLTSTISLEQIQELPNSGNDMTYVALISPGTVISTSAGYGNFSANGLPATGNLFTMNGQNANDMYLNISNSGASNLMLGANELAEATVVLNGYSAQYGQLPGAQVNFLSKSGTNNFHGNAAWLWNGRSMNANDFFNNSGGAARPFENANQWYTSIGGPIVKDKTFFFFDYEGLRNMLPTSALTKVPTQQFETATINNLNATGQTAAAALYQKAFALYNAAPGISAAVPVSGGGCGSGFTVLGAGVPCAQQFRSTLGNRTQEDLWAARVDQNVGSKDKFYFRVWRDTGTQPTYTDPIAPIFNDLSPQPQYQGHVSETHTFGATAVNQLVFSAFHYSARFGPPDENAVLSAFPTVLQFSPAVFANLGGTSYNFPQGRNVTQYQLLDDFSKTYTGHTLKVGVNYRRYDVSELGFQVLQHGRVIESNLTDFYNGGGTGNRLQIRFPSQSEQPLAAYQFGVYVQDDWRAMKNLTVNLSLRTDRDSNPVCGRNCFERLSSPFTQLSHDVTQPYNSAILANQHQAYADVPALTWQPRAGFAWTARPNTVVRGGIGIFEYALPGTLARSAAINTPGVVSFTNIPNGKITPGVPGNLFDTANNTYQALIAGFNSGATFASLKAANPTFAAPAFFSTESKLRIPTYQEWNLEVQQALGDSRTVLSVNYVGNHGIHEYFANTGLNAFCSGGCFGLPTAAPDPRFSTVTVATNAGVSNFNGLTFDVKRRLSTGFTFDFNYTWSHALDMVSNGGVDQYDLNTAPSILNPENPSNMRKYNYGNADYDVRHALNASYLWSDLLRTFFHSGPNAAIAGWTLSGTLHYRTGLPFSVIDTNVSGGLAGTNFGGPIFAQQVASGPTSCGKSSIDTQCFADSMFTDPTSFATQTRNQFFGPKYFNTDLSLAKTFHLPKWEGAKLGFGMQAYNILNHPNFDKPVNDYGQSGGNGFAQIQNTVSPATSVYGSFVGAAVSGRVLQTKIILTF
jgi:Carboxypeptidase regulatory-like domain